MQAHQCFVLALVTVVLFTKFPLPIQLVVLLPGWPVILLPCCPFCRNKLSVNILIAPTRNSSGSEYTTVPLGIVTDMEPLNVNPFRVEIWMAFEPALSPTGKAMEAAVMGKSDWPKVLESWMRSVDVGMETWNVWRSVASVKMALAAF